jgi:hypothetical protein
MYLQEVGTKRYEVVEEMWRENNEKKNLYSIALNTLTGLKCQVCITHESMDSSQNTYPLGSLAEDVQRLLP